MRQAVIADTFSGATDSNNSKSESMSRTARTVTTATNAATEVAIGNALRRRLKEDARDDADDMARDIGPPARANGPDGTPPHRAATGDADRASVNSGDGGGGGDADNSQQPLLSLPTSVAASLLRRDSVGSTGRGIAVVAVSSRDDILDEVAARKQRLSTALRRRHSDDHDDAGVGVVPPLQARAIIRDAAATAAGDASGGGGGSGAGGDDRMSTRRGSSASASVAPRASNDVAIAVAAPPSSVAVTGDESRAVTVTGTAASSTASASGVAKGPLGRRDRTAWASTSAAPKDYSRIIGGSAKVSPAPATSAVDAAVVSTAGAATAPSRPVALASSTSAAAASVMTPASVMSSAVAVDSQHGESKVSGGIVVMQPVRFPGERSNPPATVESPPATSAGGVGVGVGVAVVSTSTVPPSYSDTTPHMLMAATSVSSLSSRTVPLTSTSVSGLGKCGDGSGVGLIHPPSVVPE